MADVNLRTTTGTLPSARESNVAPPGGEGAMEDGTKLRATPARTEPSELAAMGRPRSNAVGAGSVRTPDGPIKLTPREDGGKMDAGTLYEMAGEGTMLSEARSREVLGGDRAKGQAAVEAKGQQEAEGQREAEASDGAETSDGAEGPATGARTRSGSLPSGGGNGGAERAAPQGRSRSGSAPEMSIGAREARGQADNAMSAAKDVASRADALRPDARAVHAVRVDMGARLESVTTLSDAQQAARREIGAQLETIEAGLAKNPGSEQLKAARTELLKAAVVMEFPLLSAPMHEAAVGTIADNLAALRDRLPEGKQPEGAPSADALRGGAGGALLQALGQQPALSGLRGRDGDAAKLGELLGSMVKVMASDDQAMNILRLPALATGDTSVRALSSALRGEAFADRGAAQWMADALASDDTPPALKEALGELTHVDDLRSNEAGEPDTGLLSQAKAAKAAKLSAADIRAAVQSAAPGQVEAFDKAVGDARELGGLKDKLEEQAARLERTLGGDKASEAMTLTRFAMSEYIDSAKDAFAKELREQGMDVSMGKHALLDLARLSKLAGDGKEGGFQIARYAQALEAFETKVAQLTDVKTSAGVHEDFSAARVVAVLNLDREDMAEMGYSMAQADEILQTAAKLGEGNWRDADHVNKAMGRLKDVSTEALGDVNNQAAINKAARKDMSMAGVQVVDHVFDEAFTSMNPLEKEKGDAAGRLEAIRNVTTALQNKLTLRDDGSIDSNKMGAMRRAGDTRQQLEGDKVELGERRAALDKSTTELFGIVSAARDGSMSRAEKKDKAPVGLDTAKRIQDLADDFTETNLKALQSKGESSLKRYFGDAAEAIMKGNVTQVDIRSALPHAEAVIELRGTLKAERKELSEIKEGLKKLEGSRDTRLFIGSEGSVFTGLGRILGGKGSWNLNALTKTGTSDLREAHQIDRTAHDAMDRIIRAAAAEVMLDTHGETVPDPFEPMAHLDEMKAKLQRWGVDTDLMKANIIRVLTPPMTARSMEKWASAEAKVDTFRRAMGTDPKFLSEDWSEEAKTHHVNKKAIGKAIALQMTKQAEMNERTRNELTTMLSVMEPGDAFEFKAGRAVDGTYNLKLDPTMMSSVTFRLGGQNTKNLVIRRTEDGWDVGGLKGFLLRAGLDAKAGLSLDSFTKKAADHDSTGFVAETHVKASLDIEGGQSTGDIMRLPDTAPALDALLSTVINAAQGEGPGTDLMEATDDAMDVKVTQGSVDMNLELASRLGFRAKDKDDDDALPGGLLLGGTANAGGEGSKRTERGESLDVTYKSVTTTKEWRLGFKPTMFIDARNAASTLGDRAAAETKAHELAEAIKSGAKRDKDGEVELSLGAKLNVKMDELPTKKAVQQAAGLGDTILKTIMDKVGGLLGATKGAKVQVSKNVSEERVVENSRIGGGGDTEISGAGVVRSVDVGGPLDLAATLRDMMGDADWEAVAADPALEQTLVDIVRAAGEREGDQRLEVARKLSPEAKARVQRLEREHRVASEIGDTDFADALKAQAKAELKDDANYQTTAVRLTRDTDTSGRDSSVNLSVIDISRAHGMVAKQELAAARFGNVRI